MEEASRAASAQKQAGRAAGGDSKSRRPKRKRKGKTRARESTRNRTQKQQRRGEYLRDQVTRWGKEMMPKTPHCPKGMQFVNTDFLVDAHELGRLEENIRRLLESEQDQR